MIRNIANIECANFKEVADVLEEKGIIKRGENISTIVVTGGRKEDRVKKILQQVDESKGLNSDIIVVDMGVIKYLRVKNIFVHIKHKSTLSGRYLLINKGKVLGAADSIQEIKAELFREFKKEYTGAIIERSGVVVGKIEVRKRENVRKPQNMKDVVEIHNYRVYSLI